MILAAVPLGSISTRKPRASGDDPRRGQRLDVDIRVNPARAGMIPPPPPSARTPTSKPRASGDDPRPFSMLEPCEL